MESAGLLLMIAPSQVWRRVLLFAWPQLPQHYVLTCRLLFGGAPRLGSTFIEKQVRALSPPFLAPASIFSDNNSVSHAGPPVAILALFAKTKEPLSQIVADWFPALNLSWGWRWWWSIARPNFNTIGPDADLPN
jgi:hypothetical protein